MQKIKKLIAELRKCQSVGDMSNASWFTLRNGASDFSWQDWCNQLSDEIYIAHEQDMADYARTMFPSNVTCSGLAIGDATVKAFKHECLRHDMVERLRDTTFGCLNGLGVLSVLYETITGRASAQMAASDMGYIIRKALIEVLAHNEFESAPIEDACESYEPHNEFESAPIEDAYKDYEPLEGSITGELRSMVIDNPDCDDVYAIDKDDFDRACDAIDAVHANLEGCYESATKARVDAEIAQHREICDALKNIKSLSGPYRNMVENYNSVRASRDRWKKKANKAERYASLMEQMLRDARDEFVQNNESVQEKDVCGNTKVGSFNLGIMFDGDDGNNKTLIGDLGALAAYLAEQLGYQGEYAPPCGCTACSDGEKS